MLKYLARYTHRVAISNQRLVRLEDGKVSFLWKDYTRGNRRGVMTLDAHEFIRRFLLHALPKGFVRIRYFGFMAHQVRKEKLALVRKLIAPRHPRSEVDPFMHEGRASTEIEQSPEGRPCLACEDGRLLIVAEISPALSLSIALPPDTS